MPCSIPRWTGFRCSLVGELRVPAPVPSLSVLPSPLPGRVGIHITTFEACSSFTRVTACIVAPPPYVGFIARLRPRQFPGSDARKLPSSTNNLLGWVLPPLVICAVEAHPVTSFFRPLPCTLSLNGTHAHDPRSLPTGRYDRDICRPTAHVW